MSIITASGLLHKPQFRRLTGVQPELFRPAFMGQTGRPQAPCGPPLPKNARGYADSGYQGCHTNYKYITKS